ncbi:YlbL family protein [Bifidobacterium scaligerum]|uniref:endopeptidase La n=1 Tax=Bifidobacterium scaligerum TaxID=2052656 RepID=A0A2M9HR61_9BIFI|nr:S16 family serine protease [Bifidobacterium scaligerum]PJM79303.1 Lon protease [Bifidobacterium scaligerum]
MVERLKGFLHHIRDYFAARSIRHLAGLFAVVLGMVILLLPSSYVIEMPGPTQNVLGKASGEEVIAVQGKGVTTYRDSGKLLLVTVSASGVPGYPIINAQAVWGWANPHVEVMPQEAVVPVGQTADEYRQQIDDDMTGSQDEASEVGLRYVREHAQELGVDADALAKAKVTMHVDSIGGPSAGMMYTLGLIDKLTPATESGGLTIAGTGTIDKQGKVGSIGGIRLKMLGAKRDGATWFLAPEANCSSVVGHVPDGLRDVKVSTLDEAYQALVAIGKGQGDDLPHCTA